jgi:hypothetical protein
MATRPTSKADWATNGGATIIEPASGVKATGWTAIKPPFQYMNWLQNLAYQWFDWLDQQEQLLTTEVTNARGGQASIDARIDLIDTAVSTAEGDIDDLETEVSNARGGQVSIDARLDLVDTAIAGLGTWENIDSDTVITTDAGPTGLSITNKTFLLSTVGNVGFLNFGFTIAWSGGTAPEHIYLDIHAACTPDFNNELRFPIACESPPIGESILGFHYSTGIGGSDPKGFYLRSENQTDLNQTTYGACIVFALA